MNYNSNSAYVAQVQGAINALGYSPQLMVDGKYGPATRAGVLWYQTQKGLAADGIIGDAVMGAVHGMSPVAPPPSPIANLQAQLAQLQSAAGTSGAPVGVTPGTVAAAQKILKLVLPAGGVVGQGLAAGAVAAGATVAASSLMVATPITPIATGVVGAGIGSIVKLGLGTLIGGLGGGIIGIGIMIIAQHKLAAEAALTAAKGAAAPGAKMHGERPTFGHELDLEVYEYLEGSDTFKAGDLGTPAALMPGTLSTTRG